VPCHAHGRSGSGAEWGDLLSRDLLVDHLLAIMQPKDVPDVKLVSTCRTVRNSFPADRFTRGDFLGSHKNGGRRSGTPAYHRSSRKRQEQPMKLNTTQVEQTLNQMDAHVLPDTHPAVTQLTSVFGDHTFFLDKSGLKVLEPAEVPETGAESGEVVSLADWTDATLTSLTPHEPESTGTIVIFREVRH
jgi:hypothetical protein